MKSKALCLLLLLSCLCLPLVRPAHAKRSGDDLQSLILLGLQQNLGLQSSRIDLTRSRAAIGIEEGGFAPEIFMDGGYSEERSPNSSSLIPQNSFDRQTLSADLGLRKKFAGGLSASLSLGGREVEDSSQTESLNPRYLTSLGLELRQPLLRDRGPQVNRLAVHLARGRSLQATYHFLQQAQNLSLGIEIGYYELLNALSEEALRKEARELTEVLLKANQRKLDAGLIPISELQQAETALAGSDLDYLLAKQQREVDALRLNRLLNNLLPDSLQTPGNPEGAAAQLAQPGRSSPPELAGLLRQAETNRPDLRIAQIEIEQNRQSENSARIQRLPQLDLSLQLQSVGLAGEEREPGNLPYSGSWGDSLDSMAQRDGYLWGAGLQFSYPLGNQSAKSAYLVARQQTRKAQLDRRDLRLAVETELRERLTQVRRLGEMVEVSDRFQELAEISFKQEVRRLDEGLSDTFRVLDFQEKMIAAKINRFAALIEYNKSLASLSYAIGTNLLRHGIVADLSSEEIRFEEN